MLELNLILKIEVTRVRNICTHTPIYCVLFLFSYFLRQICILFRDPFLMEMLWFAPVSCLQRKSFDLLPADFFTLFLSYLIAENSV